MTRPCSTSSVWSRVKHFLCFWYVARISSSFFTLVIQSLRFFLELVIEIFFMGEIIAKALIDAIIVPTLLLFVISDNFLLLKTFYCLAALDCQLSDSVYKGLQVLLLDVKLHSHSIICISAGLISNSWINMRAANADGF